MHSVLRRKFYEHTQENTEIRRRIRSFITKAKGNIRKYLRRTLKGREILERLEDSPIGIQNRHVEYNVENGRQSGEVLREERKLPPQKKNDHRTNISAGIWSCVSRQKGIESR